MKILVATHNPGKIKELTKGIHSSLPEAQILTLADLSVIEAPDETGKSFEENALIKANYYFEKTGIPTIADDGGIIIDALGDAPGVKSSRWLGRAATDEDLIDYCLKQLKGVPIEKRSAKMGTCLCYKDSRHTTYECEWNEGSIAEKTYAHWEKGFPYRALFLIKKFNKFYDELTPEEYAQINHRLIAVKRLAKKLL